jgi:hypothetical protein
VNNFVLEIPKIIDAQWIKSAVESGFVVTPTGQKIFVRKLPDFSDKNKLEKINEEFMSKSPDEIYVFHGTNPESLPGIIEYGLFGLPDRPVFSSEFMLAPAATAKIKESETGYGIITVWKVPANLLETGFNSDGDKWFVPSQTYKGEQKLLPLRNLLKESEELRFIEPSYCIGILVLVAYSRKV